MVRELFEYQCTAVSMDAAVEAGLAHFSCRRTDLDVEILQPARRGFFGLFGCRPAFFSLRLIDRNTAGRLLLQRLLDLAGFAGEFELQLTEQTGSIDIQSSQSALIIGRRGQTIDSFEILLNGLLDRVFPGSTRLSVDCGGYRRRQKDAVRQLALKLVDKVRQTGQPVSTEPLPPDQRQIMHHLVKTLPGLTARSLGQGQLKKMVISSQRR